MKSRWTFLVFAVIAWPVIVVSGAAGAQTETPRSSTLVSDATPKVVLPGDSPGVMNGPVNMAAAPNAVWVGQHRGGEVDRIDPATNKVVARVQLNVEGCVPGGCAGLQAIVADRRDAWVVDDQTNSLVHIDARTNRVVGSVATGGSMWSTPVMDGRDVWVALSHQGDIQRIDGRRHTVTVTVHIDAPNTAPLAMVHGVLWASSFDPSQPPERAGTLYRIDPQRATVTKTIPGVLATNALVADGDLWLYACVYSARPLGMTSCPTVKRVDGRTGTLKAEVTVDGVPFETGQASDGTIFVVSSPGRPGPQWVTALDPAKNRVTIRYDLDGIWTEGQVGLSVVHGALWLGNWTTNSVYRIDLPIHPHE